MGTVHDPITADTDASIRWATFLGRTKSFGGDRELGMHWFLPFDSPWLIRRIYRHLEAAGMESSTWVLPRVS